MPFSQPSTAAVAGAPLVVATPATLAAITAPAEADQRYVQESGCNWQFIKNYLTNSADTPVIAAGVKPTDNTIGLWQPAGQQRPSDAWIPAGTPNQLATYYTRKWVGGAPIKSIEFEVNHPAAPNAETRKTTISIPDFAAVIAGTATVPDQNLVSNPSGFYGGPAVFIRPSNTSVVVACVRADNTIILHNQNISGSITGLIRRVKINGLPADPVHYASLLLPDPVVLNQAPVPIANLATGGNIGTSAATVDVADHFIVTQNTAGQALTLPAPTNPTSSPLVTLENSVSSSVSFTAYGQTLSAGVAYLFGWNGSAWKFVGGSSSASAALYRVLVNPGGSTYTQAQLQTAYDNQPGLPAPDTVPQAVSDYASLLNTTGYKVYLGHNLWYYTNVATGITAASWTAFSGNTKGPFGAAIVSNGLITFK